MPQQINLCTPILLTQKRHFSAQTMLQALAVFVVLGGGLCAYWVWSLNLASAGFKKTLATQARELESLQVAIAQGKPGSAPVEANLTKEIQTRKTELAQRESLMAQLQRGLVRPGWGHAARLQLLAQSIPEQAWVTAVTADDNQFEVSGFTLEPAALNDWVARMAASPLLEGQTLSTVKVENTGTGVVKAVAGTAIPALPAASPAAPAAPPALWSFHLVSTVAKPPAVAGGKP